MITLTMWAVLGLVLAELVGRVTARPAPGTRALADVTR